MKKLAITFFLLANLVAYSQTTNSDSIQKARLEPLNRNLHFLPKSKEVLEFEASRIKMDNITSCLVLIEYEITDSVQLEIIYKRLEDFAEYFYQQNEPLIIVSNGLNSVEQTEKLNRKKHAKNINYVSLGNSCLGNIQKEIGIKRFNNRTQLLLNLN
jgi:hypothetical protein